MPQTRSRSRLWAVAPLAVLVFAVWQMIATLSREPAFNRSIRTEAPGGSSLLSYAPAMYDRAEYYFWMALGWYGRTVVILNSGANDPTLQQEKAMAAYARLREAATESLRFSPGQPDAWMLLAKAQAALGSDAPALAAWRNWHDLTPRNARRASDRLNFLVQFTAEPGRRALALSVIDPEMIREDLRTMRSAPNLAARADRFSDQLALPAIQEGPGGKD